MRDRCELPKQFTETDQFSLPSGDPASTVILRLHLKGLENFKVTNGKITLEAAVSGQDSRQWMEGKEDSPLDSKSPYWMEIRAVGMD